MSVAEAPSDANERWHANTVSDDPLFEVIDGLRVDLLMSTQNVFIASRVMIRLGSLIESKKLGYLLVEMMFDLPLSGRSRKRRPDLAFVSFERWPEDRVIPERGDDWHIAPDLAIEFVSPNDEADELMDKLEDYFESGVRQAWVIYPRRRVFQVFNSISDVRGLREPDEIDGGEILPGVRLPVNVFFPSQPKNGV